MMNYGETMFNLDVAREHLEDAQALLDEVNRAIFNRTDDGGLPFDNVVAGVGAAWSSVVLLQQHLSEGQEEHNHG